MKNNDKETCPNSPHETKLSFFNAIKTKFKKSPKPKKTSSPVPNKKEVGNNEHKKLFINLPNFSFNKKNKNLNNSASAKNYKSDDLPKISLENEVQTADKSITSLPLEEEKNNNDLENAIPKQATSSSTAFYAIGQYKESYVEDSPKFRVVVAIDFGTAFSGYAFSFLNDATKHIHMMGKWENGDPGVINQKTPSTLLLKPDGTFHSFGFTARNCYQDLSPEEAMEWMLFDNFKMSLYKSNNCNLEKTIEAVNGKRFSAFKVITETLKFFRNHAVQEISLQTGYSLSNDDILWVLTVPAIWSSPAKQFMRLAAYEAGLASSTNPNKLVVALEPEAAAIHICRLRQHQLVSDKPVLFDYLQFKASKEPQSQTKLIDEFEKQCRYIILDCGGGTVDITVHEMNSETGLIHELRAASGGPYGATNIDLEFRLLLEDIFGSDFVESFHTKCPNGWLSLMMFFESRKRAADPMKPSTFNIALPFSFLEHFRKMKGHTVEQVISRYGNPEIQWTFQGMLRLSLGTMTKLFQPCTDKIGDCIRDIVKSVKGIRYIFMVGGLSESPVLQHEIRQLSKYVCGSSVKVIIPQEASLAVVKGAVSFGLNPEILTARKIASTYGAAVLNLFDAKKHLQNKQLEKDGKLWCKDIFDVFIKADELINCGHVVERTYVVADAESKKMYVNIYSSPNKQPLYVTDADVSKCANICLDLSKAENNLKRLIRVRMEFAATEIKVSAVDSSSGRQVEASIDFINV
ncbi:hypothetical protein HELRODRAFT_80861 [Helobdella robusta]|uniref:Heat shock 70 kDa protein 12A n=1 Tax=Helobdella robusta TaxID=6412 RepID=T1G464_HELRO|nr:hypothetical protein HELRODRAFT_80861 [Helobdella robusta]ESO03024.1 hypothetical protein HELRODRAFT_80861 [Helobdella robusta]